MAIVKASKSTGAVSVIPVYANKKVNGPARWFVSGYRKKARCELCGFKAANEQQMDVFHVDGNRNNTSVYNLKTICANCQRLKSTQDLGWSIGDLEVDD